MTVVKARDSDDDFQPDEGDSTDDEETIAQEEILDHDAEGGTQKSDREKAEIDALKRESEMPLEDLLDDLPAEYFENMGKPISTTDSKEVQQVH